MLFEVEVYETLPEEANEMLPEKMVGVYELVMSVKVHAMLTVE